MAHIPINHPLQPLYRVVAALCGLYVLVVGVMLFIGARGQDFFAQEGLPRALLIQGNQAFGVLSIVVGLVLFGGAIAGGNLDHWINLVAGGVFLVAGMAMMALLQTDLNFLGYSMSTCVASFILGLLMLTAGLYGKVGTEEDVRREEAFRHGRIADPDHSHPLTAPNPQHGDEKMA